MADRPLIDDSLALLNFSGLITYENDPESKLKKIFFTIGLIICYIDVLLYTLVNLNKPGSIEAVLVAFSLTQVVVKLMVYKSRYILTTLEKMKQFHPLKKGDLKRETQSSHQMFFTIKSYLRSFFVFFIMVLTLFAFKTFLFAEKQLPFGSIVFGSKEFPVFEIGYFYEVLVLVFITPIQVGFDILYISIITNIVYEFKLLKRGFAQLPIKSEPESDARTMEILGDLINHHNVILECSKALRRAYYIPFLCIFTFNMIGIGFCLLCIIANGFFGNLGISVLYGSCTIFYTAQLFLYCAPGTVLISESTGVADVIFDTDWWIKTQPQLRKAYVRVLQRANKPVLLSAGGMINVTLQSFTAIVKSTVSLFTCVQAMYKKT